MKYDAHLRARASLARKVADCRRTLGMNQLARASIRWASGKLPEVEDLIPAAYEAIAAYEWPEGWGIKYSRFRIFGKPMYVDGLTKNIPARIVRQITTGMPLLPHLTVEGAQQAETSTVGFDFEAAVEEARMHLEQMTLEMNDADDGLLATPAGDSTIDRRRRESLDASCRVEEARIALEGAWWEHKLFGGAVCERRQPDTR